MRRTGDLFAVMSAILLVLGFVAAKYAGTSRGMTVTWPGSTYAVSLNAPCYGIAALFGAFACLYSIGYIPFTKAASQWHFCLSVGGVILFGLGYAMLGSLALGKPDDQSSRNSVNVVALCLLGGPSAFASGQLLFVFMLVRAFLRMHRH